MTQDYKSALQESMALKDRVSSMESELVEARSKAG